MGFTPSGSTFMNKIGPDLNKAIFLFPKYNLGDYLMDPGLLNTNFTKFYKTFLVFRFQFFFKYFRFYDHFILFYEIFNFSCVNFKFFIDCINFIIIYLLFFKTFYTESSKVFFYFFYKFFCYAFTSRFENKFLR